MEAIVQFQLTGKGGMPSPVDGSSDTYPHDFGSQIISTFAEAGVTDWLVGPPTRGQNLGNGYDIKTLYDFGDRSPTRYGSRQALLRQSAICKANGMGFHMDAVLAHRDGGDHSRYEFPTPGGGVLRMPLDKTCFVNEDSHRGPVIHKDHVAVPTEDFAYLFGEQVSYFSGYYKDGKGSHGPGYPLSELRKALRYAKDAFGFDGARFDNIKSLDPEVVRQVQAATGLWGVGEDWSSNIDQMLWLIFGSQIRGGCSLYDYPLFFELRNMCNNTAKYDMRRLQTAGLYQRAPFNAVTFVNNHDLDANRTRIQNNMPLAYAMAATVPGLFGIYVKDWLEKLGYGYDDMLTNALWFRHFAAQGEMVWRWLDYQFVAYERLGTDKCPGALILLNNDSWSPNGYQVTVQTHWRNTWLHDYSGHMPQNVKTDDDGRVRVGVKRNDYGTGYSFYAPDGLQGQQIAVTARAAVQTFEGAADLNYPPARAGGTLVMPIWCAPHRPIHLAKGFGEVEYEITDPTGHVVVPRGSWKGETRARGWHRLMAYATTADEQPYKVTAEYWATRSIAKGE
jgi:alpha-amylase